MKSKKTLENIRDIFIEIEEKNDVFTLAYEDIYYWKLIRFELFELIKKKLDIAKEGHPLTLKDKAVKAMKLVWYSFCNIYRNRKIKKADVLLLTHGRKTLVHGKYIDLYLNNKIEELDKNNISYVVIDRADHYGNHQGMMKENYIYFERFGHIIREGLYKIGMNKINVESDLEKIQHIEDEIKEKLEIDVDLKYLIKRRIFRFKVDKKYYNKLLNRIKPKKLYLVVSYGKEDLIAAAKERNIEVVELQHGVISNYHMGYYFPFKDNIPYFPNKLIVQGEFWKESVSYPKDVEIAVESINSFNKVYISPENKKENSVLFISQGSIGRELSKVAARFSLENKIVCYYKLHPSEFNIWKSNYKELVEASKKGFIKVVEKEENIYSMMERCKYIIGVYSTAIYESLLYDSTKVFVIDIEGYQYMDFLIKNNYIILLEKNFNLEDLTKSNSDSILDKSYFFV